MKISHVVLGEYTESHPDGEIRIRTFFESDSVRIAFALKLLEDCENHDELIIGAIANLEEIR